MGTQLVTTFEQREARRQGALSLLDRTLAVCAAAEGPERANANGHFKDLRSALESNQVRLVVLGEFSRGKSKLINALLGGDILPTNQAVTTAVNTFVQGLPPAHKDPFLRVTFMDGQPEEVVPFTDPDALIRWGSELENSNAARRRQVDFIEVFLPHPLLDLGLVIIDTPGLEAIVEHHEAITRKAIAGAHVALWVQSSTQLGGNAREFKFMKTTLRDNFRKFVTVVNFWDKVLEPEDKHERDRQITPQQREAEALAKVQENFRMILGAEGEATLAFLTAPEQLMGVSAMWALEGSPEQRGLSNIDRLAGRIGSLFSSGEALDELYYAPLKKLNAIQVQTMANLEDRLREFTSNQSLEERKLQLERIENEIARMETDFKLVAEGSKYEHDMASQSAVEALQNLLVAPLEELRGEIDAHLTVESIAARLAKHERNIGLPDELNGQFAAMLQRVQDQWDLYRGKLKVTLEDLRVEYGTQMEVHLTQFLPSLENLRIELPALEVNFDLDLSGLERHAKEIADLQEKRRLKENEVEELEAKKAGLPAMEEALKEARQALDRAEKRLERHGQAPPPAKRFDKVITKDGGWWTNATYAPVEVPDYSNVTEHRAAAKEIQALIAGKEERLQEILTQHEKNTGERLSIEKAQQRFDREVQKLEQRSQQKSMEQQQMLEQLAKEAAATLRHRTSGQITERIKQLKGTITTSVKTVFETQLTYLGQCVDEQFLEPLRVKRQNREEVASRLQAGQAEVDAEIQRLRVTIQALGDLREATVHALNH